MRDATSSAEGVQGYPKVLCMTDNNIMLGWVDRSRFIDPPRRSKSSRLSRCSYVRTICGVLCVESRTGDILEIVVFWSIRAQDIPSFDRYFSQLYTFYTDYRYVHRPPTVIH